MSGAPAGKAEPAGKLTEVKGLSALRKAGGHEVDSPGEFLMALVLVNAHVTYGIQAHYSRPQIELTCIWRVWVEKLAACGRFRRSDPGLARL